MTSIKPAGHHLVVAPVEVENETKSGIIVVVKGSMLERLEKAGRMIGEVLAIGPQCWLAHAAALEHYAEPESLGPWAKVGEMVIYSKHAGKFIFDPISGDEVYLIHDEDVLATLPPQADWKVDVADLTH
jgi:co-chaperonin GroES (HSP10)